MLRLFILLLLPVLSFSQTIERPVGQRYSLVKSADISLSTTTLSGFTTTEGTASTSQSFTVTVSNLIGNISVVEASPDFEISLSSGSGYTNSINTATNPVTIYARITSSATEGIKSGTVTVSAAGSTSKYVSLYGEVEESAPAADTVVAQFNTNQSSQSVSGWVDVSGDPKATNVTSTDSRNFQPVTIRSIQTGKWAGLGGGVAAGNANGVNSAISGWPAALGQSYWYNNYPTNAWSSFALADTLIRISGLDPNKTYRIETYSAIGTVLGGCPQYYGSIYFVDQVTTNRVTKIRPNMRSNTTTKIATSGLKPNANGIIWMAVFPDEGGNTSNCGHVGILNAIQIIKEGD